MIYYKSLSLSLSPPPPPPPPPLPPPPRDKSRDYDFLSSLDLIIVDQADVYLMQNWDHLVHLFDHTNQMPKDSHDVDYSRVRSWYLSGWSKFYKQLLVFSSFVTPEINSLFNTHSKSIPTPHHPHALANWFYGALFSLTKG